MHNSPPIVLQFLVITNHNQRRFESRREAVDSSQTSGLSLYQTFLLCLVSSLASSFQFAVQKVLGSLTILFELIDCFIVAVFLRFVRLSFVCFTVNRLDRFVCRSSITRSFCNAPHL
jgi:hypothetical protein